MITYFDWGEYVIWHLGPGVRVSMDGRRETVYSGKVGALHDAAYFGRAGGIEYALGLGADYAWLPARLPLTANLEAAGWGRLYATPRSVVLTAPGGAAQRAQQPRSSLPDGRWCFPGP
jgi:hypothetical protein